MVMQNRFLWPAGGADTRGLQIFQTSKSRVTIRKQMVDPAFAEPDARGTIGVLEYVHVNRVPARTKGSDDGAVVSTLRRNILR